MKQKIHYYPILKTVKPLIKQTHTRPEETLDFKMTKSREIFPFNSRIHKSRDWMLGLTSLEVYNSISKLTEENNNLKLYKFPDSRSGGFSYEKVRDENEKELGNYSFYSYRITSRLNRSTYY